MISSFSAIFFEIFEKKFALESPVWVSVGGGSLNLVVVLLNFPRPHPVLLVDSLRLPFGANRLYFFGLCDIRMPW